MEIIKFVQAFSTPFLDRFFYLVTMAGSELFFMAIVPLIFWCVDKRAGYRIGFTFITSTVLNVGLKELFKVPRPIGQPGIKSQHLETASGYSFPSGHSQSAASFWVSVMAAVRKGWVYTAGIIVILLVGLSRIYLGVHTPADVVSGFVIGTVWVLAVNAVFDHVEKTGRNTVFLVFIIPALIGMVFLKTPDYYKSVGTLCGIMAGYLAESRYIHYNAKAALWKQAVKYVIGVVVIVCIRTLLKNVLPVSTASDFLCYFLMGLWLTAAAPFVFEKLFGQNPKRTKQRLHT